MKIGRRHVLKVLGLSPGLLVPWTPPVTEQPALPAPAPPPPPVPVEPEKLRFEEAMKRVDWTTLRSASSLAATATVGFSVWRHGNDGPGSGLDVDLIDGYAAAARPSKEADRGTL